MWFALALAIAGAQETAGGLEGAVPPEPPERRGPISVFVPTGITGGVMGTAGGLLFVWGFHQNQSAAVDPGAPPLLPLGAGALVGGLAGMGGGLVLGRAATGARGPFAVALGAGIGALGVTSLALAVPEGRSSPALQAVGLGSLYAVGPLLGLAVSGKQKTPRGLRAQVFPTPTGFAVSGTWSNPNRGTPPGPHP